MVVSVFVLPQTRTMGLLIDVLRVHSAVYVQQTKLMHHLRLPSLWQQNLQGSVIRLHRSVYAR